ncbi:MAG: FHA domain-containing protein [Pseudomonadota bacterium]|nr:MAG: FHA domain-containing protein [Pseudomonadota bacterium]
MSATLKYTIGDSEREMPCKTVLTIGRDKNSDIVLDDLMVSRNHAIVRRIGRGDYYLIDSGSSNGSYVNQRRVAMPTLLKNGDWVTVGHIDFLFNQSPSDKEQADAVSLQDTIVADDPTIRQSTILVADIRGFTTLSEQVHIKTLTKMMNSWFNNVSNVIVNNGGAVDKFIGDCVFARWDSDSGERSTVAQALRAAWLISLVTEKLNRTFPEVTQKVRIGVGINTGPASVGVGLDNTALGDAVNIAFRLENATKALGSDVVMSASSYRFLPRNYWEGKEQLIRVKGKRDTLRILALNFTQLEAILQRLGS